MAKLVSNVYGDALFELALELDRIDEFTEEVNGIIDVLEENKDLSKMMCHPKIDKDEKTRVVENIFKGRVSDEIVGLMVMVIEKDHFKDMEDIFEYYISRVKEYKNIGVAYVKTPSELSDTQKKKTADILNENVRKQSAAEGEGESEGEETGNPEMALGGAVEYKSESLLEQAKALQDLSKSTNNMLIWIASISLLVGGIGVMNIMLVSVTERTREIGLKKALGARKKRILGQFLTEAVVLTSIGGLIGVVFGIGLSKVIANLAEVPVSISTKAIVVSVVFSMAVGIIFGLLPSIKAARLNPIDALRYE